MKSKESANKTAVIVQPCFFPWRGQFHLFQKADFRILLDDVQYVRRSWYNRNRISSENGPIWITVPVKTKGMYHALINEIEIDNNQDWQRKILTKIHSSYKTYPYFEAYYPSLESLILKKWVYLSDLAEASLNWGAEYLRMNLSFVRSSSLNVTVSDPINRLVGLCKSIGANRYISGPTAKNYIHDDSAFTVSGIELSWMEYDYPPYPQKRDCGDVTLSVIDLLFNVGPEADKYIWNHEP